MHNLLLVDSILLDQINSPSLSHFLDIIAVSFVYVDIVCTKERDRVEQARMRNICQDAGP